jgi:parvulin-like peptidyl-prolyl isomerase
LSQAVQAEVPNNQVTANADIVLARVDGVPITQNDLITVLVMRQLPETQQDPAAYQKLVQEQIDRFLLMRFLKAHKAEANPNELDEQFAAMKKAIEKNHDTPDAVWKKLGVTEDSVKKALAYDLAWRNYAHRVITAAEIKKEFDAHKTEWDGTQVKARQIFMRIPPEADQGEVAELITKLQQIKQEIEKGELTFEDAARKYSQSRSASRGGNIGTFQYYGRMPLVYTKVAFALKQGQVSEPFRVNDGLHMYYISEIIPGDFSWSDVQDEIRDLKSSELRTSLLSELRSQAKIEILPLKK